MGDAMFYPEVPLLQAMLVITVVVVANKGLDALIARSERAEQIVDGEPLEAVRDGVVSRSFMETRPMSRDELFQKLREDGIEQLGEVRRTYIEKDGKLTVFRVKSTPPRGLPIVPPAQIDPPALVNPAQNTVFAVCTSCGSSYHGNLECRECDCQNWTLGVV